MEIAARRPALVGARRTAQAPCRLGAWLRTSAYKGHCTMYRYTTLCPARLCTAVSELDPCGPPSSSPDINAIPSACLAEHALEAILLPLTYKYYGMCIVVLCNEAVGHDPPLSRAPRTKSNRLDAIMRGGGWKANAEPKCRYGSAMMRVVSGNPPGELQPRQRGQPRTGPHRAARLATAPPPHGG